MSCPSKLELFIGLPALDRSIHYNFHYSSHPPHPRILMAQTRDHFVGYSDLLLIFAVPSVPYDLLTRMVWDKSRIIPSHEISSCLWRVHHCIKVLYKRWLCNCTCSWSVQQQPLPENWKSCTQSFTFWKCSFTLFNYMSKALRLYHQPPPHHPPPRLQHSYI